MNRKAFLDQMRGRGLIALTFLTRPTRQTNKPKTEKKKIQTESTQTVSFAFTRPFWRTCVENLNRCVTNFWNSIPKCIKIDSSLPTFCNIRLFSNKEEKRRPAATYAMRAIACLCVVVGYQVNQALAIKPHQTTQTVLFVTVRKSCSRAKNAWKMLSLLSSGRSCWTTAIWCSKEFSIIHCVLCSVLLCAVRF